MSVSPEIEFEDLEEDEELVETSRTYRIDFENMRLTNEIISGKEAVRQFVHLAIRTQRFSYAVYSDDTGSELEELLKDAETTPSYKMQELPRLIEESIIYDERIESVSDFQIEHIEDAFHIQFIVWSDEGAIEIEEVL